jgi:hypothetical protein
MAFFNGLPDPPPPPYNCKNVQNLCNLLQKSSNLLFIQLLCAKMLKNTQSCTVAARGPVMASNEWYHYDIPDIQRARGRNIRDEILKVLFC